MSFFNVINILSLLQHYNTIINLLFSFNVNFFILVNLQAGESALIEVSDQSISGQRVVVYDSKENPINAIRNVHIENSTSTTFCPGSIAVYNDGRIVSQAIFTPLIPGDDTLIAYGEDSTISVTSLKNEVSHDIIAVVPYWSVSSTSK